MKVTVKYTDERVWVFKFVRGGTGLNDIFLMSVKMELNMHFVFDVIVMVVII